MTVLVGDRPQPAWGDDFVFQYSHFLLCFRPISALWAVLGRNNPMLAGRVIPPKTNRAEK